MTENCFGPMTPAETFIAGNPGGSSGIKYAQPDPGEVRSDLTAATTSAYWPACEHDQNPFEPGGGAD